MTIAVDRGRRRGISLLLFVLVVGLASGCDGELGRADSNRAGRAGESSAGAPETRVRVRVEPVRRARLAFGERVTGTVRAYHRAELTAEIQGRVLERVVEPGTRVEQGDVIVRLEDSRFALELRRAQAALTAARTVERHAKRELERGDQLFARNAISTQRLDDLRHAVDRARDELALALVARDTARRNLADTRITAPFDGDVDSVAVDVGDYVAPGTQIATLVDLSRVRIVGGVTAGEAARLAPGTTANVAFADLGGEIFEATLESVARVASESDGTYAIELWLEDVDERMRDGLVAQIALPDPEDGPRLVTRRAALLRRDGQPEVFVVEGVGAHGVARARRIRTGRREGQWVEIRDGLEVGERVVWDGHFALAEGTPVVVDGAPEGESNERVAHVNGPSDEAARVARDSGETSIVAED